MRLKDLIGTVTGVKKKKGKKSIFALIYFPRVSESSLPKLNPRNRTNRPSQKTYLEWGRERGGKGGRERRRAIEKKGRALM